MLSQHINNLEMSIVWAQQQDDIDVLNLAKENMDQLMGFVNTLPVIAQVIVHERIDQLLPMEWPMWMEACRYEETFQSPGDCSTYH